MSYFYGEYWLDGTIPKPMGTGNRLGVPNQAFRTTDGHVIIVANDDAMWRRIAQALDAEKLDIPEYRPIAGRRQHRVKLIAAIGEITRTLSTEQLVAKLEANKVVASPLLNVAQAAEHPQLKAIGGVAEIAIDGVPVKLVTAPFRMEATPPSIRHAPPALAAHTEEVLRELGYGHADVAAMRERGAFGGSAKQARAEA
jgi:crotonobetainyl-CoA:carnitine CoA-transferase CaiB-like acyl-CoA transferase